MNRQNVRTLLLLAGLFATGCNPSSAPKTGAEAGSPQEGLPTTSMTIGHQKFTLEVASTGSQHQTGLMYRDSMPADHGMIFVFASEQPRTFWMKHTRLPLDIVYVDAKGKVVSVHQMQPFDLSGITSRGAAQYAVELNQGAAAAAGVKDGDQLQLPADVTSLKPDAM